MKFYLILAVLARYCSTLVFAAPLREHEPTRAVDTKNPMSLAKKILSGIPDENTSLTLSSEGKSLEYLISEIGIPAPPVLTSEGLTLDVSLTRILKGLELHHKLLQEITAVLNSTDELKLLIADITDLSVQVQQMQQPAQIPGTEASPRLSLRLDSEYRARVAAHLSLQQLRSFTQDVLRTLRHISASNP